MQPAIASAQQLNALSAMSDCMFTMIMGGNAGASGISQTLTLTLNKKISLFLYNTLLIKPIKKCSHAHKKMHSYHVACTMTPRDSLAQMGTHSGPSWAGNVQNVHTHPPPVLHQKSWPSWANN